MNTKKTAVGLLCVLAIVPWFALTAQASFGAELGQWYRGQLHTHSYWSDGRAFPEQAVEAYKQRGYHFLSLTDHNRFADNPDCWREVCAEETGWPPTVSRAMFDAYVQSRGAERVEVKTEGDTTRVRLRTFAELAAEYDEPGTFLLLPGVEPSQTYRGTNVHCNYINLPLVLPCVAGDELCRENTQAGSVSEVIAMAAAEAKQAASALGRPYLFFVNHPFWIYCDIVPQNLIECPEVRFFEICNGGSVHAPHPTAVGYTPEKLWDVVNAFRCRAGEPLLYGVGTDDAHFYDPARINNNGGVGDAWVMVRAAALTPEALVAAMDAGDFYASTGVALEDVAFSPAERTLRVKVKAEKGVDYTIRFVTTKRDFDPSFEQIASPAEGNRPARSIPVYSDDIGRTVKTVKGVEAEYCMASDDLYVRAVVESDRLSKFTIHFHPTTQVAWTQPYAAPPAADDQKADAGSLRFPKILFLGNSITWHATMAPDWTGDWGMAASAEDKDYVHLVTKALSSDRGAAPAIMVKNIADFERGYATYDIEKNLKEELAFEADLIVLAIGENVAALESEDAKPQFRDHVTQLLRRVGGDRHPTVVVRSNFWPNAAKDAMLKEACDAVDGIWVDISGLSNDEANYARSEREFSHAGVAAHPGDRGMKAIAEAILNGLQ